VKPVGSCVAHGMNANASPELATRDRLSEADEFTCAICLNLLYEPVLWPAANHEAPPLCRHLYCRTCVLRCIISTSGGSCPLCRAPVTDSRIQRPEDLPIVLDVQRRIMQQFPLEHAEREADLAGVAKAWSTHQVLLHTVHSNPLQLRPRKGTVFKLWLRPSDETLLMVAAALTTPSRRLGICLEENASEGAVGCFASIVGYSGRKFTFASAVAALLKCKRTEDDMIRVKLQVGDPFEVCRVTRSVWVAPPDEQEYTSSPSLPFGTVRARQRSTPSRLPPIPRVLSGGVARLRDAAFQMLVAPSDVRGTLQ